MVPFLIEDVTPRSERIPQHFAHQNKITGIEKVTVAVGELSSVEKWYNPLLGTSGQTISETNLGAVGLRYHAGPHTLDFLTPRDPSSPLIKWLRKYGPSPYAALLKSHEPSVHSLDPRLTHGANLLFS